MLNPNQSVVSSLNGSKSFMRHIYVINNATESFFSLDRLPNTHQQGEKLMKET